MPLARNPTEVMFQRRQVDAWIRATPATIVLNRPVYETTAAGGRREAAGSPTQLAPQTMMLVPFKRRLTVGVANTSTANTIEYDYVLVGRYDADAQVGDWFVSEGGLFTVEFLEPDTSYRKAFYIIYHGPAKGVLNARRVEAARQAEISRRQGTVREVSGLSGEDLRPDRSEAHGRSAGDRGGHR